MATIKEKAIETERNTRPMFESIRESTGEPVSVFNQYDMRNMFEAGANYVLEQIEEWLRTTDYTSYKPAEHDLWVLIEQLKK